MGLRGRPSARPLVSRADLLTAEEAAELLHLHVKRVQLLARQGKLPAVRHGRRWLFLRDRLLQSTRPGGLSARISIPASAADHAGVRAAKRQAGIDISARNQLRGRVRSVVGDGLMAEVTIAIDAQDLVAVITRSSADRLGLAVGVHTLAVVKSTEVMVARRR